MSIDDPTTIAAEAEAVRRQLLEGKVTIDVYALAVQKTPRCIYKWIDKGLPMFDLGNTRYVILEGAKQWHLARSGKRRGRHSDDPPPPPPRRRGRPRKDHQGGK